MLELIDLTGKNALITGASSGIGEVAATQLAKMGAAVYLLCRNEAKGQAAIQRICLACGHSRVHLIVADLAEQAQIHRAAKEFLALDVPLHILLNNAGITNTTRRETADGIEQTFAVNHLGYFLLTRLLLDKLKHSAPARIVNVASHAHHMVSGMQFDDLEFKRNYRTFKVYGQSKLANLLFTKELSRRLAGTGVTVNAVHPGAVATALGAQNGWLGKVISFIASFFLRSPQKGAESSIYACASPQLQQVSGKYFYNCKEIQAKPWAQDGAAARKLWRESERMLTR
ncbi:MAG: SDR family oxidoreductase [Pseudomonadales bacterium]|nr:SDR family oxidoreductase [Pseudomonadales bacterium]